jgi:hypothetical protein
MAAMMLEPHIDPITFFALSTIWLRVYYKAFSVIQVSLGDIKTDYPKLDPILKYFEIVISVLSIFCISAMISMEYADYPILVSIYTIVCGTALLLEETMLENLKKMLENITKDD